MFLLITEAFFSLYAEPYVENVHQVIVPRDVFIGDSAQIQYSFSTSVDLFANRATLIKNGTLKIKLDENRVLKEPESCTILDAILSISGGNYSLRINFIPWRTGKIAFNPLNVSEYTGLSQDFYLELKDVEILSLVEKLDVKNLRPSMPPAVLPETNYILWFLIILALAVFSGFCILIVKFPYFIRYLRKLKKQFGFYKNAHITRVKMNALLKDKKISDSDFAYRWQMIVRNYLEYRFSTSFSSVTASNIGSCILSVTGGMTTEKIDEMLDLLESHFVRTNYIRFASGSIDSMRLPREKYQASFLEGEKLSLVSSMRKIILVLEKGDVDD